MNFAVTHICTKMQSSIVSSVFKLGSYLKENVAEIYRTLFLYFFLKHEPKWDDKTAMCEQIDYHVPENSLPLSEE